MKSVLSLLGLGLSFVFLSGFTTCQTDVPVGADDGGTSPEGMTPGEDATAPSGHCKADSDCSEGEVCGFVEADGCSAAGRCFPMPAVSCAAGFNVCDCEGATMFTLSSECAGLPHGTLSISVAHIGACVTDAGPGTRTVDGGSCATDSDCAGGGVCGFSETEACSATGRCFPMPTATCASGQNACACDGTTMFTLSSECAGLPDGYLPIPVARLGDCPTDGGSGD